MGTAENTSEEVKIYCADCDCEITTNDAHHVNADGDPICDSCAEDYRECADCGKVIHEDDAHENADGDPICESCREDYCTCGHCDTIMHDSDATWIEFAEIMVCESCLDNRYYRCEDCGEYVEDGRQIELANGDYICQDCYCNNGYFTCDACEEVFSDSEYNSADDGDAYCNHCFPRYSDQAIHDYGYKPEWDYHLTDADRKATPIIRDRFFLGIELEVENKGHESDDSVAERVAGMVPAVCKHDSSINNGFEIVFHPQTYDYATTTGKADIEAMLDMLRKSRFAGHNYGGIHVHITKSAFSRLHLYKFHLLFRQCEALLTAISQRKASNLNEWAAFSEMGDLPGRNDSRYSALNYTRHTVEVRIFNSTIRTDRFFKNLEAVKAALDFSKQHGIREMNSGHFLRFIMDNRAAYKNLVAFLVERNENTLKAANVDAKAIKQVQKSLSRRSA